jgi:hypothetical protein
MPFIISSSTNSENFQILSRNSKKREDDEKMTEMLQGKLIECKYCDATGKVREPNNLGILEIGSKKRPCPACGGSGYQRV